MIESLESLATCVAVSGGDFDPWSVAVMIAGTPTPPQAAPPTGLLPSVPVMLNGFELGMLTVGLGPRIVSAAGNGGTANFATSYCAMRLALLVDEEVGATASVVSMYTD